MQRQGASGSTLRPQASPSARERYLGSTAGAASQPAQCLFCVFARQSARVRKGPGMGVLPRYHDTPPPGARSACMLSPFGMDAQQGPAMHAAYRVWVQIYVRAFRCPSAAGTTGGCGDCCQRRHLHYQPLRICRGAADASIQEGYGIQRGAGASSSCQEGSSSNIRCGTVLTHACSCGEHAA